MLGKQNRAVQALEIRALHVYPSDLLNETRILKETKSLVSGSVVDEILLVGIGRAGLCEHQTLDRHRKVWRVALRISSANDTFSKIVKFLEWYIRIIFGVRGQKFCFVNCHSLSTLPLCALLAWLKSAALIYDTHELETETATSRGPRKFVAKIVEKALIGQASLVIVVTDLIADWYRGKYGLSNVVVVKNIPVASNTRRNRSTKLRQIFNISDNDFIFIYQGLVDEGRGIDVLLNVIPMMSPRYHCVVMGNGPYVQNVKDLAASRDNIHYLPAVSPNEILEYTASADIGVTLPPNSSLSYYYSLGNKFFEYIMAGIPVIASNFPEMKKFIDDLGCGHTCEPTETGFDCTFVFINIRRLASDPISRLVRFNEPRLAYRRTYNA